MERFRAVAFTSHVLLLIVVVVGLLPAAGCHSILATGVYLWEGGHMEQAECDLLEDSRVVVLCQPPSSHEYRHADASRDIAKRVSLTLANNVKGIDIVNPREVDNWIDESDWGDSRELGKAVKADKVLHIEMDNFDIFNGSTLYQGNAEITLTIYDMNNGGELIWDKPLGQMLYPVNSGIPAQDKSEQQFLREFVVILSAQIARHFHEHEAHADFAIDALSNR